MPKSKKKNLDLSKTLVARLEEVVAAGEEDSVFGHYSFNFAKSLLMGIKAL